MLYSIMLRTAPVPILLVLYYVSRNTTVWKDYNISSMFQTLLVESAVEGCRYRNLGNLPPEIFSYWADWGCYTYTRPDLFADQQLQASICYEESNNTKFKIPGIANEEQCIPFNHRNMFIKKAVEKTFCDPGTVKRWIRCCQDADLACKSIMMKNDIAKENECPDVWDGWSFFPAIPSGQTYHQVCSRYAYAKEPPQCHHYSSKTCHADGTWEDQTDYTSCDITPQVIFRTLWHMIVLSISIVICIPTILITVFSPTLHTEKLSMVRLLLIVLVLRNFFVIIVKGTLILEELTSADVTVMSQNSWSCRMLSVLEKFFGTAVFTSMLLEGVYLHQMLTNVFRARLSGGLRMTELYLAGFFVTLAITLAWALAMALNDKQHCWQVTEGTDFHWIFDGPRLIMLLANLMLLVRIVWALWSTFRLRQDEQHPLLRTTKAALICLPLFGVPFFFLLIRPDTTNCTFEQLYYLTYYTVEALQGALIAILHCYSEKEVKAKISAKFKSFKKTFFHLIGRNNRTRSSDGSRRLGTVSVHSSSSTPRSSIQSRRESDTSASTLATPQTDCNRERFSFPLPRIQEDDERKSNNGANLDGRIKQRLSAGNLSTSSSTGYKSSGASFSRRHSADETEVDRPDEFFELKIHQ